MLNLLRRKKNIVNYKAQGLGGTDKKGQSKKAK